MQPQPELPLTSPHMQLKTWQGYMQYAGCREAMAASHRGLTCPALPAAADSRPWPWRWSCVPAAEPPSPWSGPFPARPAPPCVSGGPRACGRETPAGGGLAFLFWVTRTCRKGDSPWEPLCRSQGAGEQPRQGEAGMRSAPQPRSTLLPDLCPQYSLHNWPPGTTGSAV